MAKPCVLTTRRLFWALDRISKNMLIDMLVHHAMVEHSNTYLPDPKAGDVPDEEIAAVIQFWIDPVVAIRNAKPFSLTRAFAQDEAALQRYERSLQGIIPLAKPGDARFASGPTIHNPEEPPQ